MSRASLFFHRLGRPPAPGWGRRAAEGCIYHKNRARATGGGG
jgi:hypothetical protein